MNTQYQETKPIQTVAVESINVWNQILLLLSEQYDRLNIFINHKKFKKKIDFNTFYIMFDDHILITQKKNSHIFPFPNYSCYNKNRE